MVVQIRVSTINLVGKSVPSALNISGALIERVPHKPPVSPTKNSATISTLLVVDYMHLYGSSNGGSEITSYEVEWDQGPSVKTFVSLQTGMSSQVSVSSNISPGLIYGFRYRA